MVTFRDSKLKTWNEKMQIPILAKLITPSFNVSIQAIATGENMTFYVDSKISRDRGKTQKSVWELFASEWNRGNLYQGIPKKDTLIIEDSNWAIETKTGWIPIVKFEYSYDVKEEYRFNYLEAKNFIELKNTLDGKLIYGEYELEKSQIRDFYSWKKIKNVPSHLEKVSSPLTITKIRMLKDDEMEVYNFKIENLKR